MSVKLQILLIIAIILYFITLFSLLKKERITLKYTLLWIFSGLFMSIFVIYPKLLEILSEVLGIHEPTNALFFGIISCIIVLLMSLTAIVSNLSQKNRKLVQTISIMDKRLKELETEKELV